MRLAFANGSTHWFQHAIAGFSIAHHAPQNAYAAAFVLMVLTLIVIRTAAVIARVHHAGANLKLDESKILRRLARI
jgi:hypothetical protein